MKNLEYKAIDVDLDVKEFEGVELEENQFITKLSSYGRVDKTGDYIEGPEAYKNFEESGDTIFVLLEHDRDKKAGAFTKFFNIEGKGFYGLGEIWTDVEHGRVLKNTLKSGAGKSFSIGYQAESKDIEIDGMPVRELTSIKLFEASQVMFPADEGAKLVSVKNKETEIKQQQIMENKELDKLSTEIKELKASLSSLLEEKEAKAAEQTKNELETKDAEIATLSESITKLECDLEAKTSELSEAKTELEKKSNVKVTKENEDAFTFAMKSDLVNKYGRSGATLGATPLEIDIDTKDFLGGVTGGSGTAQDTIAQDVRKVVDNGLGKVDLQFSAWVPKSDVGAATSVEVVTIEEATGDAEIVPEGSTKPSISVDTDVYTLSLGTIAVTADFSRQAVKHNTLSVDRVRRAAEEKAFVLLEDKLINGTKTGADVFNGLENQTVATQAAGPNEYESLLLGLKKFKTNYGVSPTILMHPNDVHVLNTLREETDGAYIFGVTKPTVIEVPSITAGHAWVLDRNNIEMFTSGGVQFYVSDSHASNFKLNMLTLLVEFEAAGLAIYDTTKVIDVTL